MIRCSLVINILVLFLYSSVYSQDTISISNKNPSEEVHFKKLYNAQQKYLHWIDKRDREFPFAVPAIAYNKYDGTMIGAALVNLKQPVKNVDFTASLLYGINSKKVSGTTNVDYYFKPKKGIISLVKPGVRFQSFSYEYNTEPFKYYAIHPEIEITFKHRSEKLEKLEHQLAFENHVILKKDDVYDFDNAVTNIELTSYYINEFFYRFKREDKNFPINTYLSIEQAENFAKLNFEINSFIRYQYKDHNTGVHFRLFMGAFLWRRINKPDPGYSLSGFNYNLTGNTGSQDYKFDNYYVGRSENEGLAANQISKSGGYFKVNTPLQSPPVGQTGTFLFSLNTTIDFPLKYVPLKFFFDIGFIQDNVVNTNTPPALKQFAYDGGFMFSFFDEGFEIYFPLFYSKEFKTYYKSNAPKFGQRISFLLDLHKLEIHKKIRDMKF